MMKNKKNKSFYDILFYNLIISALFFTGIFLHGFLIEKSNVSLPFSLTNIYLFFAIASSIIVTTVVLLQKTIPNQLGYLFLTAVFIKLGLFLLIFSEHLYGENQLEKIARISIIVPLFIFLAFEGVAIGRTLKSLFKEIEK